PFIDEPGADIFVRLVDAAVQKLEGKPCCARLLQQPFRLRPRLLDIGREPGDLLQFLLGRGQWRGGGNEAPASAHNGDLRQCRRAVPPVDGQGQRTADAGIVERPFLVVRRYQTAAIPVALLHSDFIAQRLDEFVARRRREATELDRGAVRAYRVEPD